MERLRNKKRLAPTPLDELCDELSKRLSVEIGDRRAFEDRETQTERDQRQGRINAIRECLELARAKQRTQR